jgi:hypothetical protein
VTPKGDGTPNHQYGHGRIHAGKINLSGRDTPPPTEEDEDGEIDLERILRDILRDQQ